MKKEVLVSKGNYFCAGDRRVIIVTKDLQKKEEAINAYMYSLLSTFDCFQDNECPSECPIKILSQDLKTKLRDTNI